MNRGQVLIPQGDGRWKYRDDVKAPVSALAVEAWRAIKAVRSAEASKIAHPVGMLTYKGRKQSAMAWAHELGINAETLYSRLHRGWTVEDALGAGPSAIPVPRGFHARVLNALRAARQKLGTRELCERLHSSVASKRVEKALRALCDEGLVVREGRTKGAVYWPTTTQGST